MAKSERTVFFFLYKKVLVTPISTLTHTNTFFQTNICYEALCADHILLNTRANTCRHTKTVKLERFERQPGCESCKAI